jgi:hypothetical protein
MSHLVSIPQTRQQVIEMRQRLAALHDSPSSGEDTRRSALRNIEHCDFLIKEIDAGTLVSGVSGTL